jgi:hypothetical protein
MLKTHQYRQINSENVQGVFDKMIHLVSIIQDLDPLEVGEWTTIKLIKEYNKIQSSLVVSERHSNTITIDEYQLSFIDLNTLKLGQFIDLEQLVSNGFTENLNKIAATIYLHFEGGGMFELIPENYGKINVEYRSQLIDELPINSIFGACKKYISWREKFFNAYDIFTDPLEGADPSKMDDEELAIYNEEVERRKKSGSNQWETLLNALTNNDITKFDSVLDMNVYLAFNQITFLKNQ